MAKPYWNRVITMFGWRVSITRLHDTRRIQWWRHPDGPVER